MTDEKIIELDFNEGQALDRDLFGVPLHPSWHTVFIEGRCIPRMHVREWDGMIEVLLDDRWVYQFPDRRAARIAATMAANAMAIGEGYPWLGADSKQHPFAPKVMGIGEP